MDIVGGYRLVRKLGFGARAEVYLGHAGTGETDTPRVAAVKLFRRETDDQSIGTEIEALSRVASRHLVELRDVATDEAGRPCLLLRRTGPESLARLLVARDTLRAGEAVTILSPLVQAVADLHAAGVAHGALRLSNVLFDEAAAPVLIGFGAAALLGAASGARSMVALSGDASAMADLAALALLCRSVLDRTAGLPAAAEGLYRCLDALASMTDRASFPDELAARIFELGEPLPLELTAGSTPETDAAGTHAQGTHVQRAHAPRIRAAERSSRLVVPITDQNGVLERTPPSRSRLAAWKAPEGTIARAGRAARALLQRMRGPLPRHSARVRRGARGRKPALVGGLLGAGLLIVSLTAIPPGDSSRAIVAHPAPTGSTARSSPPEAAGDDPAAAVRALLEVRAGCLRDHSVACLEVVDQADSAALENDRQLIRTGRSADPESVLFPTSGARLIQRLGDTALVAIELPGAAGPVSLLVVRADGNWRIRDILSG